MNDLRSIADALGGEVSGGQVLAPGPGHSSKDRSLSVKPGENGEPIVHSFAGDDPIKCKDYVRGRLGMPPWQPSKRNSHDKGNGQDRAFSPVVASYVYKDAAGAPYNRVQRTADKKFWQQHWTGSTWENGKHQGPKIPYRLPELIAADPAEPVYIVEGEKDADRLASLGFVATTASEGAGKWRPELNKWFAGRTIYIITDNDEKGAKGGQQIAENLHGVAVSVRVVELPGLGPRTPDRGKDVSDWLDIGNLPENIPFIAEQAPEWSPPVPTGGWRDHVFTAAFLKEQRFDPVAYVVPRIFPEGLTILAGRPKVGKSWLALDLALGIGGGRYVLGDTKLEEGDVLYAALEDNQRRLRSRIDRILSATGQTWPERVTLATKWRRLDAGGVADAREWAAGVKRPRLVIFDTLAGVRPDRNNKDTLYDGDYRALTELQSWLNEARIGGLILHHTRKMEADDPIDSVSGSLGLTGCADTVSVLSRTGKGTTLYVRGRDVEEQELAVAFNKATCRWTIQGNAEEVHQSEIRAKIVTAMSNVTLTVTPLSPKEIADLCDVRDETVRQRLPGMIEAGQIIKVSRGLYIATSRADLLPKRPPSQSSQRH